MGLRRRLLGAETSDRRFGQGSRLRLRKALSKSAMCRSERRRRLVDPCTWGHLWLSMGGAPDSMSPRPNRTSGLSLTGAATPYQRRYSIAGQDNAGQCNSVLGGGEATGCRGELESEV